MGAQKLKEKPKNHFAFKELEELNQLIETQEDLYNRVYRLYWNKFFKFLNKFLKEKEQSLIKELTVSFEFDETVLLYQLENDDEDILRKIVLSNNVASFEVTASNELKFFIVEFYQNFTKSTEFFSDELFKDKKFKNEMEKKQ